MSIDWMPGQIPTLDDADAEPYSQGDSFPRGLEDAPSRARPNHAEDREGCEFVEGR